MEQILDLYGLDKPKILVASDKMVERTLRRAVVLSLGDGSQCFTGILLNSEAEGASCFVVEALTPSPAGGDYKKDHFFLPLRCGGRQDDCLDTFLGFCPAGELPDVAQRLCPRAGVFSLDEAGHALLNRQIEPCNVTVFRGALILNATRLRRDVENGLWHVLPFTAALAFKAAPHNLWDIAMQEVKRGPDGARRLKCQACESGVVLGC